jgi:hypothetical protein
MTLARTRPLSTPQRKLGRRARLVNAAVAAVLVASASAASPPSAGIAVSPAPGLDAGFQLLYELKPAEARARFAEWQTSHPGDPLGSVSEAASYLFEECYRQGVLTSEFFLDDTRLLGEVAVAPDPAGRAAFFAADQRARDLSQLRLTANANDADALFAMTLALGMQADYAALIEKRQLDGLRMIRSAGDYANRLLQVAPDAADAYLVLGAANYVIGSQALHKRLFLRFAGIRGDKREGIRQLEIVAARGRYLRPFARILLALAALREKQTDLARAQLTALVAEFPQNPLFVGELAKLLDTTQP